jgi:GH24 family phage-related lysozyme (muramidase)
MSDATASAGAPTLPNAAPAPVAAPHHQSSQAGIDLIVTEEDSGQAYYTKHYVHFEWPEGASGPTVGIGQDCGYVTAEQIRKDWVGIIPDAMVEALVRAAGLKGAAAGEFVRQHYASVTITWDQAMAEFDNRELPKWEAQCRAALPNYDELPGDCAGAIDSLAYNRGSAGFHTAGSRYAEMRNIEAHMAAKRFDLIPAEYLSMRRLWPVGGDLWRRRGHEAALFEQGLKTIAAPVA